MTTTLWQVSPVRFGAGHGSVLLTVAVITGLGVPAEPALLALLAVTVVWGSRMPLVLATGLGAVAWAYYTGFVVNQFGQLTFATADVARLILLLAAAAAAHWSR